jgi:hypothetical protein
MPKSDVDYVPLRYTDQFLPVTRRRLNVMGYRYRKIYEWDCTKSKADQQKRDKYVYVEPAINFDHFNPRGQPVRPLSQKKYRAACRALGVQDAKGVNDHLVKAAGKLGAKIPWGQLSRHFTGKQSVIVYAWVHFRLWMAYQKVAAPSGKTLPLPLFNLGIPYAVSFDVFVTGHCPPSETKSLPKTVEATTFQIEVEGLEPDGFPTTFWPVLSADYLYWQDFSRHAPFPRPDDEKRRVALERKRPKMRPKVPPHLAK